MSRLPLAAMVAAAQRFGLQVEVVPGAETRGANNFNPVAFIGHHTAGPKTGVRPSLNICVNGRSDLPGPLCNWFLDRNGVAVIVACGTANHAGAGGFRGLQHNWQVQGCEAESSGLGSGDWTDKQLWAYPRVTAAGLWLMSRDESWYCAHRTWAPTRKIDPTGLSDDWMRRQVRDLLALGGDQSNEEGDVSYDDAARAMRDVLHLPAAGAKVPVGQRDNEGLYANVLGTLQKHTNTLNEQGASLKALAEQANLTNELLAQILKGQTEAKS